MLITESISLSQNKYNDELFKGKMWQKEKLDMLAKYIQNKQKVFVITTLTGFIILGASFGILNYYSNTNTLYEIFIDGQKVGTVNNKDVIEDWKKEELLKIENKYGIMDYISDNNIEVKGNLKYKGEYNNSKVINSLGKKIDIQARAVAITIDGKTVGYVKDKATAYRLMTKIKQKYLKDKDKSKVKIFSASGILKESEIVEDVRIKGNVNLNETKIEPSEIISEDKMLTLLSNGTLEKEKYTVKKGDTISSIAASYHLTVEDIYQLNPDIKNDIINIGDQLLVTTEKPLVTVQVKERVTKIEEIPFKIEYKKDNSKFENENILVKTGINGKKEVQYSYLRENGDIVERVILSEKVVEEPEPRVIIKGTKAVPKSGSGVLSWPTDGGVITSYFGPRWGSTHDALDIAGTNSKTIRAADNGTVIFAGWKGSYGNMVMIDHKNGMVTIYAHLSKIGVNIGDKIAKGQTLGIMGSTGRSTGTHLHFEVRVNGEPRNPLNYLGK